MTGVRSTAPYPFPMWGAYAVLPLSIHVRDSSYPKQAIFLDLSMLHTFIRRLVARFRGEPWPISDADLDRAAHVLASATPEEKARSMVAARRALDAAKRTRSSAHGSDTPLP